MLIPWKGQPFPPEGQRRATAEALVRILVIDDEPSLARSITALLQADDRLIEECGTVAEALARLNATAYDLIVLDYRLPDASGLAVMDWLLSHDRRESVIMISAEQSVEAAVGAAPQRARQPMRPVLVEVHARGLLAGVALRGRVGIVAAHTHQVAPALAAELDLEAAVAFAQDAGRFDPRGVVRGRGVGRRRQARAHGKSPGSGPGIRRGVHYTFCMPIRNHR